MPAASTNAPRHRRTPGSRSLDIGALLLPPLDPPMLSPPIMQRRVSDSTLLGSSPSVVSTLQSIPSMAEGGSAQTIAADSRVKRSCSTSALSGLTVSSGTTTTTATTTISECPSSRSFSRKARVLQPVLDEAETSPGDLSNRSRSSSASTLSEIYHHHSIVSSSPRPSLLQFRSSSQPRFRGEASPPILSPGTNSSISASSEPSTPRWPAAPVFPSPPKRGRSSTVDALAHTSSGRCGPSSTSPLGSPSLATRLERPSKLRNVASCGRFVADLASSAFYSAPSTPTTVPERRFSVSQLMSNRVPLSPISSSTSPQPLQDGSGTGSGRYVQEVEVAYTPTATSCAQKCKKLLLTLDRINKVTSSSFTAGLGVGQPITSYQQQQHQQQQQRSRRKSIRVGQPAFKCTTKLRSDGKSRILVVYTDGQRSVFDPSEIEFEEILGNIGIHSGMISPSSAPNSP